MSQSGERHHDPTPRRRSQARAEGRVARSGDLSFALSSLGGLAVLLYLGATVTTHLTALLRAQLGAPAWLGLDADHFVPWCREMLGGLAIAVLPSLALLTGIVVLCQWIQAGFLFLPQQVAPRFERISPADGLGRMFSRDHWVKAGFALLKVLVLGGVVAHCIYGDRETILTTMTMSADQLAVMLPRHLLFAGMKMSAALLVLAVLDYGYERWKFEQELKMTTQELRDEQKEAGTNPQVVAARRKIASRG